MTHLCLFSNFGKVVLVACPLKFLLASRGAKRSSNYYLLPLKRRAESISALLPLPVVEDAGKEAGDDEVAG